MPANPINALTNRRAFLRLIDRTIKSRTALNKMLFPASVRSNLTEAFAQVDQDTGQLGMAPFIKIGAKARMVTVLNGNSYTIETPNINIKRPLTYSERLMVRMVGGVVFTGRQSTEVLEAINRAQTKDVKTLSELCDNREEWMVAFLIRGAIEYSVEGDDSFTIDTGKPTANTYQVSNLWDGGSAEVEEDLADVKKLIANARGPMPTTAICGATAAAAFRALIADGSLTSIKTTSGIDFGRASLISDVEESGMIFIGTFGRIDFWEYDGKYIDDNTGSELPLIRDDYIEFFSTSATALDKREFMYGRIHDLLVNQNGEAVTDRHLTVVPPTPDQGTLNSIMKSRPFPWLYRPDWFVSLKVT